MRGQQSVSLFVLVLLIAPALSMLSPAGAQDTTAGSSNLVVEDPAGDAGPAQVAGESPTAGLHGQIDVTRIEIGNDDADSFQVMLDVVGSEEPSQGAAQALADSYYTCEIGWEYVLEAESLASRYAVRFSSDPEDPSGEPSLEWFWSHGGITRSSTTWPGTISHDGSHTAFVIDVPKSWVPVWPAGHGPAAGDTLELRTAWCRTDALGINVYDRVVNWFDTQQYEFQSPGRSMQMGFHVLDGVAGLNAAAWDPENGVAHEATVASSEPTMVPLYLSNPTGSRKLVHLSAAVDDDAAAGWGIQITPSVMVPANDVRTVNIIVTPPAGVAYDTTLPMIVKAEAPGEPLGVSVTSLLRVIPVLSADQNTFYVHTQKVDRSDEFLAPIAEEFSGYRATTSLLQDDPDHDDEPAVLKPVSWVYANHYLDPLAKRVRLDTGTPVTVAVAFDGDPTRSVSVTMTLSADDETIFSITQEVPGDGVTEIEAIIPGEGQRDLDVGTKPHFNLNIAARGTGPGNLVPDGVEEIAFLAKESHFVLPIVQSGADYVLTDGRFLPSLSLARHEESTTYVNPEKEYAFDLVLTNEGIETDDLRLSVNATNATGWGIDIKPGSKFRVTPGNSTPVSLVVRAPADAQEGERAAFEVIAESKHDAAVRTQLRLNAIVTSGVALESKEYVDKDGQLAPLEEERADTPAPHVAWGVPVLAGLVMLGRRRLRSASE